MASSIFSVSGVLGFINFCKGFIDELARFLRGNEKKKGLVCISFVFILDNLEEKKQKGFLG